MRDIWNPWHGCRRISEGCLHCYMFHLDARHGRDFRQITRARHNFDYPLHKDRQGQYKIRSGEMLRVGLASDFFLEEADGWRDEAWSIIRARPDVKFFLLTKRPDRVAQSLPADWGDGWEQVFFNVSCENQKRADERMPQLLALPFKHKGVMTAPLLGPVDLSRYLATGQIEQVIAGGENYDGARPCHFDWIRQLQRDCITHRVNFCFIETGTHFIKDGKSFWMPDKSLQSRMAHKSGMSVPGKPIDFILTDPLGFPLHADELHQPAFGHPCQTCGSRPICNGRHGQQCG